MEIVLLMFDIAAVIYLVYWSAAQERALMKSNQNTETRGKNQ